MTKELWSPLQATQWATLTPRERAAALEALADALGLRARLPAKARWCGEGRRSAGPGREAASGQHCFPPTARPPSSTRGL